MRLSTVLAHASVLSHASVDLTLNRLARWIRRDRASAGKPFADPDPTSLDMLGDGTLASVIIYQLSTNSQAVANSAGVPSGMSSHKTSSLFSTVSPTRFLRYAAARPVRPLKLSLT
jgi:hypothetical protein